MREKVGSLEKDRMDLMKKIGEVEREIRFEKESKKDLERKVEKVETEIEEKIEGIMEKN